MNSQVRDVGTDRPEVELQEDKRRGWLRRGSPSGTPTVIDAEETESPVGSGQPVTSPSRRPPWLMISFILMVVIPSIMAGMYFAFVATDQYIAEARFAVRSLADDGSNENADLNIMQMQAASQDAFVVTSFIHSAEILKRLDGKVDYRTMFTNPSADYFSRFDSHESAEGFLDYWNDQVLAYIDGPSGIVTLTARTFDPRDSVALVSAIVGESEKLVNELSLRARDDMMKSFRAEVERTSRLYQDALAELNRFQQQSGLLTPELQAQETGKLLTGLLAKKLELESRLFVLQQSSGTDAPSYRQLLRGRESLDQQIEDMRGQMTGKDASLANVITSYSSVETDRLVAEKLYEAARRNYDLALAAAMRKSLYLSVFVRPYLPEEALYPKRFTTPLLIFLGLFISWVTLSLIWASVEDHRL